MGVAKKVGLRVKVFSADKREYLGLGTIIGFEKVQFGLDIFSVPVIRLDDGRVLKGCECWWISKEEADMIEKEHCGRVVYG